MRRKSKNASNPKGAREIFEARGDLYLQGRSEKIDCGDLLEHVSNVSYHRSFIVWHIATEIWYNMEKPTERNDKRELSKILSDYLLYLLVNQPNVVSVVAFFAQKTLLESIDELLKFSGDAKGVEELCEKLYNDSTKALELKSPLRQGIVLARKKERFRDMKWEVMSGVWVEILSYTAGHIKGEAHVRVLSKGGELLAFVWLLMAHFGCLYKPEWDSYRKSMFGIDDYDNGDVSTVEGELV